MLNVVMLSGILGLPEAVFSVRTLIIDQIIELNLFGYYLKSNGKYRDLFIFKCTW